MESKNIHQARIDLAKKIMELIEQEAPGDADLGYEALMLAFHASTSTQHCRELFRPN